MSWFEPDWPAPVGIKALSTVRSGGVSQGPWAGFNLGLNSGDDVSCVIRNREYLQRATGGKPIAWLQQVHGADCIKDPDPALTKTADAAVTSESGRVLSVLTADCLPVLFCSRDGKEVAVAHAGWRGLLAGVLQNTLSVMDHEPAEVMAWLGPAISQESFQVGAEVRRAYLLSDDSYEVAFREDTEGRYRADLKWIAGHILQGAGTSAVFQSPYCTYKEEALFYSYRRDGRCGRQASLIWIE